MGGTYSIPMESLSTSDLEEEKKRLTLQPKTNFGPPSPPFEVFSVEEGRFHVPRFYGLERFGQAETDVRSEGEEAFATCPFEGTLTDVQSQAFSAIQAQKEHGSLIVLPCGLGKTVIAVYTAASLKKKTAVLVHTSVLKTQWARCFEEFCPGVKVGFVQGPSCDVEGKDVVIVMLQTAVKREFDYAFTSQFGFLVCDEAHHLAAPVMHSAVKCFPCKHVLALTATKERADGLTFLLHWSLGAEVFRAQRKTEAARILVVKYQGAAVQRTRKDGVPLVASMLNQLGDHAGRNLFIAKLVKQLLDLGRTPVVFSHRINQLKMVKTMLVETMHVPEDQIGKLEAQQDDAARTEQLSRRVLLCSYNIADEGLDKKTLDTCIMGTPKSKVEQCIGRCQRPCPTKKSPLVIDISDSTGKNDHRNFYFRLGESRKSFYRKQKYETRYVDHTDVEGIEAALKEATG